MSQTGYAQGGVGGLSGTVALGFGMGGGASTGVGFGGAKGRSARAEEEAQEAAKDAARIRGEFGKSGLALAYSTLPYDYTIKPPDPSTRPVELDEPQIRSKKRNERRATRTYTRTRTGTNTTPACD